MFRFQRFFCLLVAVMTLPMCCGCVAIYSKKSIGVLVLDAETGKPIREASVGVSYHPQGIDLPWALTMNKPDGMRVTTNAHGEAKISVAKFSKIQWSVGAPDYLQRAPFVFDDSRVPVEFQMAEEDVPARNAVIRLHRQPAPTVPFVVPDGDEGTPVAGKRP